MKPLHIWVGALLVACGLVSGARAQGVAQPGRPAPPKLTPSIDLMVTEPFSQVQTETFKREDIREVPPRHARQALGLSSGDRDSRRSPLCSGRGCAGGRPAAPEQDVPTKTLNGVPWAPLALLRPDDEHDLTRIQSECRSSTCVPPWVVRMPAR